MSNNSDKIKAVVDFLKTDHNYKNDSTLVKSGPKLFYNS